MRCYPQYKESGVEWIGEMPSHWRKSRLKHESLVPVQYGLNINSDRYVEQGIRFIRTTDITDDGALIDKGVYLEAESVEKNYLLQRYDFLISRSGTLGRTYLHQSDEKHTYGGYLVRFNFGCPVKSRFILYFTRSQCFEHWITLNTVQATIGNVNGQKYSNLEIPVPSFFEQTQIVNFLDQKTGQIDELIRIKERQIELLQEQRTVLINQVVTKGLDPNVKLKPSGIEWIGEIPAHWKVINTKYLFRLVTEPAPKNNDYELLSIYTDTGVKPRKELEERGNRATTTDGYWLVKKGDFIVNKLLAWMGAIGLSNYEGVTSPAYDILRKIRPLNERFYEYLFRSGLYFTEFKKWSRGIMEVRLRLYFDQFGQIPLVFPPVDDQDKIVNFLDRKTEQIDELLSTEQRKIELLREYRQSLISEAVTGKIDVRGDALMESSLI